MPTYVVPETAEQALALLECGLLYRNSSSSRPRAPSWGVCAPEERLEEHVRKAFERMEAGIPVYWHYTDFAYVLEE